MRRGSSVSDSDERRSERDIDRAESEGADTTDITNGEDDANNGSALETGSVDTAAGRGTPYDKESRLTEIYEDPADPGKESRVGDADDPLADSGG
jgi:hypothetical protein